MPTPPPKRNRGLDCPERRHAPRLRPVRRPTGRAAQQKKGRQHDLLHDKGPPPPRAGPPAVAPPKPLHGLARRSRGRYRRAFSGPPARPFRGASVRFRRPRRKLAAPGHALTRCKTVRNPVRGLAASLPCGPRSPMFDPLAARLTRIRRGLRRRLARPAWALPFRAGFPPAALAPS